MSPEQRAMFERWLEDYRVLAPTYRRDMQPGETVTPPTEQEFIALWEEAAVVTKRAWKALKKKRAAGTFSGGSSSPVRTVGGFLKGQRSANHRGSKARRIEKAKVPKVPYPERSPTELLWEYL